jgi:hypothetical protein
MTNNNNKYATIQFTMSQTQKVKNCVSDKIRFEWVDIIYGMSKARYLY